MLACSSLPVILKIPTAQEESSLATLSKSAHPGLGEIQATYLQKDAKQN